MDWLTFFSKAIDSLAWPIVCLVLGLILRKKLLDLIPALKKLKAGPVEAEFEMETKQVLANAAEASAKSVSQSSEPTLKTRFEKEHELLKKILNARNDPAGMILEGWARVDAELFRLGQQMNLIVDPLESTDKVFESIVTSNILPFETSGLVRKLKNLRNKVAHVKVSPTTDAAQEYLLAVDRVIELIFNFRKNLPNYRPNNTGGSSP